MPCFKFYTLKVQSGCCALVCKAMITVPVIFFQSVDERPVSPARTEDGSTLTLSSALKGFSSTESVASQSTASSPNSPNKQRVSRMLFTTPAAGASKLGARPPASFGRAHAPVSATKSPSPPSNVKTESKPPKSNGEAPRPGRRYHDFDSQDPQTEVVDSWDLAVSVAWKTNIDNQSQKIIE